MTETCKCGVMVKALDINPKEQKSACSCYLLVQVNVTDKDTYSKDLVEVAWTYEKGVRICCSLMSAEIWVYVLITAQE